MIRVIALGALALAGLVAAVPARGETTASPRLALALVTGASQPRLKLEQRAIERSWGLSEDSVYREVDVPGWRSEGAAAAMSAVVPGLGQAYAGSSRAWVYALAEVAGWTTRWLYMRRGQSLQDDASAYAGAPTDSTSKWSFQRWEEATNGDDSEIRALYVRDREVFYDRIAHDPTFLDGWTGDPSSTRSVFTGLRDHADDRLRYSRYAGEGVWLNHAISALDALRAARLHNVPLGHDLKLRLGSGWSHGRPAFTAALRRDF